MDPKRYTMRWIGFMAFFIVMIGCSGASTIVARRAASDFGCESDRISVDEGDGRCTYVACGCGRKATYVTLPPAESMVCCPPIGCDVLPTGRAYDASCE